MINRGERDILGCSIYTIDKLHRLLGNKFSNWLEVQLKEEGLINMFNIIMAIVCFFWGVALWELSNYIVDRKGDK